MFNGTALEKQILRKNASQLINLAEELHRLLNGRALIRPKFLK